MTGFVSVSFGQIVDAIGLPLAVRLADARGGARCTIPARAPDGHWLVDLLGRPGADQLCARFRILSPEGRERGVEVDLPRGPTGSLAEARRRMANALEAGAPADEAARASGMTRRTAYRKRKAIKAGSDPRQPRLL